MLICDSNKWIQQINHQYNQFKIPVSNKQNRHQFNYDYLSTTATLRILNGIRVSIYNTDLIIFLKTSLSFMRIYF